MNRRDILKYAAMVTGTAIVAPLTATMLVGCSESSTVKKGGKASTGNNNLGTQFFNKDQFTLISQIMDTILPKTDSPSATEVKVNYILDNMLANIFTPDYQQQFLKKTTVLEQHFNANNFINATPAIQEMALMELETLSDKNNPVYRAYIDLKQQTISYFLSTETIAENYLNYLPIPGKWTPNISVKELGGKAWAI